MREGEWWGGKSLDPLTPVLVSLAWYRYGTAYTAYTVRMVLVVV